jgi:hypothetical protein
MNIRPLVACTYRGVFVEPLPGNALTCHNILALLVFWLEVLSSVDRIHKCLLAEETTFYQAQNQLRTLSDIIINWKIELCVRTISDTEQLFSECGVLVSRRIKMRCMPGENVSDAGLSTHEELLRPLR